MKWLKRKPADLNVPPANGKENMTRPVFSSRRGATEALSQIQEWGKWMAGIQTAALGGLGAMLLKAQESSWNLHVCERACALLAFIFLALGLLLSSYVLSSVASISLRLGVADAGQPVDTDAKALAHPPASPDFDIYEWPSFTWLGANQLSLGVLMGLQHWSWAIGLFFLAAFAIQFFY